MRINITINEDLNLDLQIYKKRFNISKVCAEAISQKIDRLKSLDEVMGKEFDVILKKYTRTELSEYFKNRK